MCQYCEKVDLKPSYECKADNLNHDGVLSIMPYKTKIPEMIVSCLRDTFPFEGGSANIYFEINFCPICGRKLRPEN